MSLHVIVKLIAAVLLVFPLAWRERSARRQKRVLGRWQYRHCMAATRSLSRFSGLNGDFDLGKTICLAGAVIIFLDLRLESNVLLILGVIGLMVVGLGYWTKQSVPASILVLGSSRKEQVLLHAALLEAALPFRPVSFLQTGLLRIDRKIAGDCFRVDREIEWRAAVSAFCRSLPLIVLDTRNITPLVQEEIEHVLKAGHAHKTLFIGPEGAVAALEDTRRRAISQTPGCSGVFCLPDTEAAARFLRYTLFEREAVPTPEVPILSLSLEWRQWQSAGASSAPVSRTDGPAPSREDVSPAWESRRVQAGQLRLFSYQAPPGWQTRLLVESAERYAMLFRPPEESGLRGLGLLRRRSRLDLMVFKYTDETILDEAAFRRATELNLTRRGAAITRERVSRRCGVMSHECFFQMGCVGYLIRFIAHGNEYLVHWTSMNARTFQRYMPTVEAFVGRLEA